MNRHPITRPTQNLGALIDAAQRRAHELRHDAIEAFWDDAACAARRRLRAAQRLTARLARHRQLRGGDAA